MIETIGEALDASWKLCVVCAWGKRDAMKSVRECVESYDVICAPWFGRAAGISPSLGCPAA